MKKVNFKRERERERRMRKQYCHRILYKDVNTENEKSGIDKIKTCLGGRLKIASDDTEHNIAAPHLLLEFPIFQSQKI